MITIFGCGKLAKIMIKAKTWLRPRGGKPLFVENTRRYDE